MNVISASLLPFPRPLGRAVALALTALSALTVLTVAPTPSALAAQTIDSNGITWTLDKDYPSGKFVTGDPWVVGPVKVVGIANKLNDAKYKPKPGQNGSMLNPGTTNKQGYDSGLQNYDASLNAGLINGEPVSAERPLDLPAGSSLVSMVSWLYNSADDREPDCPKFGGGATAPRPATRSAGILTVLDKAPAEGSFRPPYCGTDKTVRFNISALDYSKLPNIAPVEGAPTTQSLQDAMARPWVDHVNGWLGAHVHPSEHMPNYGRDLARIVANCTLVTLFGGQKPGEDPARDKVIHNLVQFGIDLTGIADNGGGWQADGGHGLGRKLPILYAGLLLNDKHMLNAGQWKTRFQENEQTFYVTQAEVDMTNSPKWDPDKRAEKVPYTAEDIGMADWGIRHAYKPEADNKSWDATYREVNGAVIPAFALAARQLGLKEAWNHPAFFDYCDRYMAWISGPEGPRAKTGKRLSNEPTPFFYAMWAAYPPPVKAEAPAAAPAPATK
ncbi:hypothetical protein DB346_07845 [Verrucomicrobia bacterium LW23]|nr:hypothetical protein DB346_07845 [Verrucomicrobia bacterium LW23]